jgi:hypothetical protein
MLMNHSESRSRVINPFRSIASIGAIITVLTLALDPFFQQIVTNPQRPSPTSKSTVARVVSFKPDYYPIIQNGVKVYIPPDDVLTAIGGFLGNSLGIDTPPIQVFCPSDECRWPRFQTMGVCSQCQDISQYLTLTCLREPGDWKAERGRTANGTDYPWSISCGYFLNASSDTPMLMTGYNLVNNGSAGEALAARTLTLHDFDSGQKYWDGSLLFKAIKVPLIDFFVVGVSDGSSPYRNSTPSALECVLKWCVKTIESTFINGHFSENVLATFQNDTQSIPDVFESDTGTHNVRHIFHNESITPQGQSTEFSVRNDSIFEFVYALSSIIPSSLTAPNSTAQSSLKYHIYTGQVLQTMITNFTAMRPPSNVSETIAILATTLTNMMRTVSNATEPVFGSGSLETYIHVRFGWLALPILVLVATLIFLIATIRKASKANAGIWKTSSLATLMHGLSWDAKMSGERGSPWRMEEMQNKARYLSVHLNKYKEGGTLDCEYHVVDRKSG